MNPESLFAPLLFLIATHLLTLFNTAVLKMGRLRSKELFQKSPFFFFRPLLHYFFPRREWDTLHALSGLGKNIYQILYALSGFFYLATSVPFFAPLRELSSMPLAICTAALLLTLSLLCDFACRVIANIWPRPVLKFSALAASVALLLPFPILGVLLQLTRGITSLAEEENEALPSREQIRELIRESELHHHLDPFDQKLISSLIHFKNRSAKEIMVPRVDIFSLSAETSIREAVRSLAKEGYSRIPIYRDSLDQIVGVVLYKDLLKFFAHPSHEDGLTLDSSLESIAKPVLYAPENKKISHLLQEFRNKQIHMAIIVDEYGGTEGIVTIEDILEELVGEIEDEYDIRSGAQFWALPNGGWIVDAKMSILDIEEQLGVRIPQDPEYETVGGYVFYCAGTIPAKGWRLMHDEFDLEVLSSNERSLKKIKIIPHQRTHPDTNSSP